jgi:hypothetical protein
MRITSSTSWRYVREIFQRFVYESLISIETSIGQDVETEPMPSGKDWKRKCKLMNHRNLEKGAKKRKNHR